MTVAECAIQHLDTVSKADETSLAVAESIAHESALQELEESVSSVCKACNEDFTEFQMWRVSVDEFWDHDPNAFDESSLMSIVEIERRWNSIFDRLVDLIESADGVGCHLDPTAIKRTREIRQTMISIELMKHGPLPKSIAKTGKSALRLHRNGKTIEFE